MFNPRWPHTLRAYRGSLDSRGLPVTDADGNPTNEAVVFNKVVYAGSVENPDPVRRVDGSFATEQVTVMPWGYRTSTGGMRDSGEVFAADYKISCPMFIGELPEGTVVVLTDYNHTFEGIVKKQTTYNWGTNLWIDVPGNNGKVVL